MRFALVLVAVVACHKPHPAHPDEDEDREGDESAHRYDSEDQAVADGAMTVGPTEGGIEHYHCIELLVGPPRVMVGDVTRMRIVDGRKVIDVAIGLESGLCPDWTACLVDDQEHCVPDGTISMVAIAKTRSTFAVASPHEPKPRQRVRVEQPKQPPIAMPDVIDAHIVRVEVVGSYQMVFIDRGLRDGITAQWKACLVSREDWCLDQFPVTLVGVDAAQAGVRVDVSLTDLNVKPIVRLRRP